MSARYFVFDTHGNCILQGEMNAVSSKFQGIPNVGANRASARETAWPITALPISTVKYQFAHRNCSVGISFSILQRHYHRSPLQNQQNHPSVIKSPTGKGLVISYQSQLCSDEGPKIAPIYFSNATLNFTTTGSEPVVRPMPTPKLYSIPYGSAPWTTGKM